MIGSLSSASAARSAQAAPSPSPAPSAPKSSGQGAATVSLSQGAQLSREMSSLHKASPAKFKEAASQVSAHFASKGLQSMAASFAESAKTGELPKALGPARPHAADAPTAVEVTDSVRAKHSVYRKYEPPPPEIKSLDDTFSQARQIVQSVTSSHIHRDPQLGIATVSWPEPTAAKR